LIIEYIFFIPIILAWTISRILGHQEVEICEVAKTF